MSLEKIVFVRCPDYSDGQLQTAVGRLVDLLGGLDSMIRKGATVLIKPNMLTDRRPDEAVTTHPEVVRAIIHIIKKYGASPMVADSPASAVKLETVWEKTGYKQLCDEERVPLLNLEASGSVPFEVNECRFNIAKPLLEADAIINVPKVKTHSYTLLTGAMKNLFGTVPGYQKTNLHKLHPHPSDFGRLISAINTVVKPVLNIADAIAGMDGNGPSAGRPVHLGFIGASRDARSLDLSLCGLLKIKPSKVGYLKTNGDDVAMEITGDAIPEIRDFRLPVTFATRFIPRQLVALLSPLLWIHPSISEECVSCGRCVTACPEGALTIKKGEKPVLNGKKCIGCCCCHEVCPQKAISMEKSPLIKFFSR